MIPSMTPLQATSKKPQRRFSRLDLHVPISICSKNYTVRQNVYTANISRGGLFIQLENYTLDKDEKVCIEIQSPCNNPSSNPNGKKIRILGTVCWTNLFALNSPHSKNHRGIGIRFQEGENPELQQWMQQLGIEAVA
jgi:hypothetical protein